MPGLDKGGGSSKGPRSPGGAHAAPGCRKSIVQFMLAVGLVVTALVWWLW